MPRHDASSAEVLVFTFKEGLLSAVAHDLKLKVARFSVDLTPGPTPSARGEFDPASLAVLTAMRDGAEAPGALPGFAKGEIEKNITRDVLDAKRFAPITFETTAISEREVEGRLHLHGVTKVVRGTRQDDATHWGAEFRLDQRDFGIKPYAAFLGTLRIRPDVVVRVRLPKASP